MRLGTPYTEELANEFDHVFYAGPIDAYFEYSLGRLRYRTVTFERFEGEGDLLGNAVVNYTQESVPFTRIHEHKHFTPWEKHEKSVAFREYSKATEPSDIPYYPLRQQADIELYEKYASLAEQRSRITFVGRLGTYRYLDMDQVIGEALDLSATVTEAVVSGKGLPVRGPARSK